MLEEAAAGGVMPGPRIVLVHGAWGSPDVWLEVADDLRGRGFDVCCVDLPTVRDPTATLDDDARYVRAQTGDGPSVLVGHSYGGMVITEAASELAGLEHLIYLAAAMPEAGESMFDLLQRRPTDALELDFFDDGTSVPKTWGDEERYSPEAMARFAARPPRRFAVAAALAPASEATWRSHPTTYIVAGRDQVLHADTQRELAAERAEAVVEIDADHVAQYVHPDQVAERIAAAAS